jgi:hypothetical protein
MTDALLTITEGQLQKLVGNDAVNRAAKHLFTGKVQERIHRSDGALEAYWDTRLEDIIMHAESAERGIVFDCTCGVVKDGFPCEHVIALLLAWITDPTSFSNVQNNEDDEFNLMADVESLDRSGTEELVEPEPNPQEEYLRLLSALTVHELREIAHYQGISLTGNRKDPILKTLVEALSRPESVDATWQRLSPNAHRIAGILPFVLSSGNISNRHAVWKIAQKMGLRSEDEFQRALDELKLAGLAFTSSSRTISIPSDLPLLLPPDPEFAPIFNHSANLKPKPVPSPPDFIHWMTRLLLLLEAGGDRFKAHPKMGLHPILNKYPFLQDWAYDQKELDELEKEKNLSQALWTRSFRTPAAASPLADETRQKLASSLRIDGPQLDFAIRMLEMNGLLLIKEGQPPKVNKGEASQWLQLSPFERAELMMNVYANLDSWTEFDLVIKNQPGFTLRRNHKYSSMVSYHQMLNLLSSSRRNLLYQIRRLPAGRWTDFTAFVERAHLLPSTISSLTSNPAWFYEFKGRKLDPGKLEDWMVFYGLFVEAALNGPLSWQGLVEVASQGKQLAAFRLTDFGAALLLQRNSYQMPSPEKTVPALEYAPDGTLLLHPESAGSQLVKLLIVLGEPRLTTDNAIAYHVSAAGATSAFTTGWDLDQVLSILQEAAGALPPANLAASLQKWWQDYGSLHIYDDIALMELADDYALNELLAGTSLSRYLLYRFSPRLVAIRTEGVDMLRNELVNKGYTPKLSGA